MKSPAEIDEFSCHTMLWNASWQGTDIPVKESLPGPLKRAVRIS
jgi:hypothetical protein